MVVNKYKKVIFAQAEGGDTHAQDCWIQFEVWKSNFNFFYLCFSE
jgi:hypothetical protein